MTAATANSTRKAPSSQDVPQLDLFGPQRLAIAGLLLLILLVGLAGFTTVTSGPLATARGRVQVEPVAIRHGEGGVVARVHVRDGDDVEAGHVLADLDTRLIDSQIAGLKTQVDAIRMRVGGLKQEAEALAATDRQSAPRQRLAGLETQMADFEQEALGLEVRLAMAQQERQRTSVVAPVAGRLIKLHLIPGGAVAPQAVLAVVQPSAQRLLLDAHWPSLVVDQANIGDAVAIWPADAPVWAASLAGRVDVARVEGEPRTERSRVRVALDVAGTALAANSDTTERHFVLQLVTGRPSLLRQFLAPLLPAHEPTIAKLRTAQP